MDRTPILALLAVALGLPQAAAAQAPADRPVTSIGDSRAPAGRGIRIAPAPRRPVEEKPRSAWFGRESGSADVRKVADWVAASGDNRGLPFMIVDKIEAKVFLFDSASRMLGAAPALLGLGRGDDSIAGIGQRRLATMEASERTTPAGRFEAALGHDLEQDVLWVDYGAAISLHRVIVGNPRDRRHQRLASPSALDNRISYGCINVPVAFYDRLVAPAFKGIVGIVYILPETKSLAETFAIPAPASADR